MMLKHKFLLTFGFAILSLSRPLGSASAQSSTRSSAATKHHHAVQARHPLYNSLLRAGSASSARSAPRLLLTQRRLF